MGSIRVRAETGALFMDFKYHGKRLREQTAMADTPANRKRLQKALDRVESEIADGILQVTADAVGFQQILRCVEASAG